MTKEEKEAIKSIKRFVEYKHDMEAVTAREMQIVLDLIQNQQAEIANWKFTTKYVEDNYISKEKIKNKINQLEEEGYWEFYEIADLDKTIQILKKILEEK